MGLDQLERQVRGVFADVAAEVPAEVEERLRSVDYRPRGRSRLFVGVAAGLVVACLGAGTAVVATSGAGPAPAVTVSAPVDLVAAVRAAVATAADGVLHERFSADDPAAERWTSPDGSAVHWAGGESEFAFRTENGQTTTVDVDHRARTWSTSTHPTPEWTRGCIAAGCADPARGQEGVLRDVPLSAGAIDALLAEGGFARTGATEEIEGRPAEAIAATSGDTVTTLWVDAETALPVRLTLVQPTWRYQVDVDWLEPTPENLARTQLTAPAGYSQIRPPN
ncbi:hypothetical protein BJF78_14150 [Pseudonocardia sp. CNS-139]|nr:hypothetical protein BJF78_14150 [Pseudonocardia sp. CNS-139]